MGILDEDVAAVRAASDIVGVVSQYVQLRRVGQRWQGLCPFHPEKTPSFSVNATEGLWYCLAAETRVLTWDGVVPISELAGTTARVLTQQGQWVDAPFKSFGVQPLMRITLARNRQRKVIHASPEHRWLLDGKGAEHDERTTAELRTGHSLAWSFPQSRLGSLDDLSPFGIAHGIVFGDGSLVDQSASLDLHGSREAQLLKWFPLNRTLSCHRPDGKAYTKVVDLPRSFKQLPPLDESPQYLTGWLAGYLAVDGHIDEQGICSIRSADRSALEFVRDVCTRVGIGTYGMTTRVRAGFDDGPPSELHRVHLITEDLDERFFLIDEHRHHLAGSQNARIRRGWVVESVEPTDRVEEVFCAVVDGTHNFTLEDNILTGNCFGCQAKGDVITFVRDKENLDFVGAVEWLAAKANVTLRYTDRAEGEGRKRRSRLLEVMARAVEWYHQRLLSGSDAGHARRYLRGRGLDGDVVREYRLGWAPDDWDLLCRALHLGRQDAEDSGLGFVNRRDRLQDSFRARVMFPIFDAQGDPVSFGGRILPGGERPGNQGKYKNTTETPLYHKSKVLYGLDRAKAGIVSSAAAVICEGYTDVIGFHRSGVATAVATCGTALTDEHVKLLRRFDARRMVLAFDADGAGMAAAERFYQWERDHDLEVAVADLPPGQDPGDVAQTDPALLVTAIERARPFLRFRLDRAFESADLSSPEGRARAAQRALTLVAEHPVAMVRDQYLMDVAGRCRIDLERLRSELDALRRGGRRETSLGRTSSAVPASGPATAHDTSDWSSPRPSDPSGRGRGSPQANGRRSRTAGPAFEVLRHAVHNRGEVEPWLRRELFGDPVHQQMLTALDQAPSAAAALAGASPDVADLLARLVVDEPSSEPFETVRRLLTEIARAELAALPSQAASLPDSADVLADSAFLLRCVDDLRDAQASVGAADRLLAWLVEKARDGG